MRPPDANSFGHLTLHADALTIDDVEALANAFAGEFLLPSEVIRPSLRNFKVGRLLDLKREYGVSMQAVIERAYLLDLLSHPAHQHVQDVQCEGLEDS